MNENTRIILGIFAGLAAGAALGLLLGPEKKSGHLNGHAALANTGSQSQGQTKQQLQQLEDIKDRLMNTFEKDDFNDHVEHV
ncbi:YtxH domain-containing protein [Pedobacter gandavensis]|uniref:YtxH domain-containing protein n=1 Tax=Pedobacter gandavensis TaxID=2679963 RepID=UPI00292F0FDF|nr:YtxH domain-containing protein [Pedobacter gandavensis]